MHAKVLNLVLAFLLQKTHPNVMNMAVKAHYCPLNASKDKMDFGTLLTEPRSQNIKRKPNPFSDLLATSERR